MWAIIYQSSSSFHKNQVVSGTFTNHSCEGNTHSPLLRAAVMRSFLKYCWMLGQPFPPYRGRDRCWVEAFGPYFQTGEAHLSKDLGVGEEQGQMGPLPTFPLHRLTSDSDLGNIKTDLSASPNFPSGGFHRLDWATGACALRVNNVLWSSLYHKMEDIPFCIFWVYFLFLNWFRKWTRRGEVWITEKHPQNPNCSLGDTGTQRVCKNAEWFPSLPPCSTNNPSGSFLSTWMK